MPWGAKETSLGERLASGRGEAGGHLLVVEAMCQVSGRYVLTVKARRHNILPCDIQSLSAEPCSYAPWVGREARQQALYTFWVDRFLTAGEQRQPTLGMPWRVCGGAGVWA